MMSKNPKKKEVDDLAHAILENMISPHEGVKVNCSWVWDNDEKTLELSIQDPPEDLIMDFLGESSGSPIRVSHIDFTDPSVVIQYPYGDKATELVQVRILWECTECYFEE